MFGNLKVLPKPLGNYVVGITHMDFIDYSRPQVFSFETGSPGRKIPVTIFYPADSSEHKRSAPYSFPEALIEISRMTFGLWSKKMASLKTQVYQDIAISSQEKDFPIIFFNQGYFSYEMQSTVLCSDLASLGYIVISIGHPYESSAVKYTDGSIIKVSREIERQFNSIFNKEYIRQVMKIKRDNGSFSDEKAMEVAKSFYVDNYGKLTESVRIWADDTIFVANELENVNNGNEDTRFKNKLQLNRGFGITGASLGGAVAAQVCFLDQRFHCGINMDGGTWGDYLFENIQTPFMTIGTMFLWNTGRSTFLLNSEDTFIVVVDKTEHWAYTDVIFGSRHAVLLGRVGVRDKFEFRKLLTDYHATFFNKYLMGNCDTDLSTLKYKGIKFYQNNRAPQ